MLGHSAYDDELPRGDVRADPDDELGVPLELILGNHGRAPYLVALASLGVACHDPHVEQAPPPGVPRLASWGRRLAAILIDDLIILIPAALGVVLVALDNFDDGVAPVAVVGLVLVFASITVGQAVYFTILNGNERGQTYGKRLLGIRVIDEAVGGPIGYGRSFGRWAVPAVVNFFCGFFSLVDGLWPLWDDRNQALHDKVAKSVVIRMK